MNVKAASTCRVIVYWFNLAEMEWTNLCCYEGSAGPTQKRKVRKTQRLSKTDVCIRARQWEAWLTSILCHLVSIKF